MTTALASLVAIAAYVGAVAWWVAGIQSGLDPAQAPRRRLLGLGVPALMLHAMVLAQLLPVPSGIDLGFFHALSLIAWLVSLLIVMAALARPVENMAAVFFPFAALSLALALLLPAKHLISTASPGGVHLHIALSILAYSLLTIAAVQALALALQERALRSRQPQRLMRFLPPQQAMEQWLVQFVAGGFFLLSLSLITGVMFVSDLLAQHLAHKAVLSLLAWLIFGMVLAGRWTRGWRTRRLVQFTLGGFLFLLLGYFGSKFVLELILHRVPTLASAV